MRRRTSAALALSLAFTACLPAAPVASATTTPACDHRPLESALKSLRGAGASGISVALKSPRCGHWKGGVGLADLRTGRKVTGDEHSRIASDTKTWVATVVLQLVAEGRIRLDENVDHYLPGLIRTEQYDGRRITVRQLLQHTSGLPDYLEAPYWQDETEHRWEHFEPLWTVRQALKLPPPKDRPASGFSYSNTNYNLAGLIVSKVTGHSISTEIRQRIINPLGLRHTSWPGDRTRLPSPDLRAYVKRGGKLRDWTEWNVSGSDASGALVSTAADVTAFWTALMSGRLLPAAQLAEMKRTVPDGEGGRYGLGVERYASTPRLVTWGHSGFMETGHKLRNAATGDGSRSVTLLVGSEEFDEDRVDAALAQLIRDLR
ncbi:serine hydrolase domain-containing protein [Streptomyces sp. NPDC047525]|uniref:serine hydrolase domain-containing protein n=1 Tax=Streptomyces sp. NPDC047525 TaxID=3155264 RepID=UPI0033CA672C